MIKQLPITLIELSTEVLPRLREKPVKELRPIVHYNNCLVLKDSDVHYIILEELGDEVRIWLYNDRTGEITT